MSAGSIAGGETLADALTLIETVKLNGLNLQTYLEGILARINEQKINLLPELLTWNSCSKQQSQEEIMAH
ncbi:hypothetical protein PsAD2_01726 [Pseudovibrio axinellae]|uniref:Transposase IS66 C-terminal domain-containing protein n=1 Tax=Pseudovibrio axinellae TaxID=989403 RepID=A0A165ZHF2_9HYPH|nr:hypothetical protein PsAD2_01726 [Pseudovibrio axinellae]SER37652.1 IS66 C-terminal element [Pseudovibrio axinellae]